MEIPTVGNDHICAGAGGNLCGMQFGGHASRPYLTSRTALSHFQEMIIQMFHHIDEAGIRVMARVICIEAIDIREQDQKAPPR